MSEHVRSVARIRLLIVQALAAAALTFLSTDALLAQQPAAPDSSARQAARGGSSTQTGPAVGAMGRRSVLQTPRAGAGAFKTSFGATLLVPVGGDYSVPGSGPSGNSQGRPPSARITLSTQLTRVFGMHLGMLRLAPDYGYRTGAQGPDSPTPTEYSMNGGIVGVHFDLTHGRFRLAPFLEGGAGVMEAVTDMGGYATTNGEYVPRWARQKSPVVGGGGGLSASLILGPGFTFNFLGGFWHFQPTDAAVTVNPISTPFVGAGLRLTLKNRPWYWRTSGRDRDGPTIAMMSPKPGKSGPVTVGDTVGTLKFLLSDLSGVKQLAVNGQKVDLRSQKSSPAAGMPVVGQGAYAQLMVRLHPGQNSYRVTATDGAGNQRTRSFDIMGVPLDQAPPVIAVLEPQQDAAVADQTVTISGVVSDQGDIPEVTVNGMRARVSAPSAQDLQKANVAQGYVAKRFEATVPVGPGVNTVKIVAQDTAAHQSLFQLKFQGPRTPVVADGAPAPEPSGIHPVIEVRAPRAWAQTTRGLALKARAPENKSLRVEGVVRYANGIREVKVAGARAALSPDATGTMAQFSGFVPVDSGATQVAIEAVGTDGVSETRVFPLQPQQHKTNGEASFASFTGTKARNRWAVVIGISDYQDPEIPDLKYADKDARAIYNFLRSPQAGLNGIPADHIQLLVNQQATSRNMRSALLTFLRKSTDDDVIFIYIAGHGAPDPQRPQDLYILTYDTELKDLAATAMPMEMVNEAINRAYAYNKVLVTDACHSAGVGMGDTRSVNVNQINQLFLDHINSSSGGFVAFTASEANQLSEEGSQWGGGHGVFTYYFLQGLKGAADDNHDHVVTLGEVMEYTRDRVRRSTDNAQIPTISLTNYDRYWPMSIVTGQESPKKK